MSKSRVLFLCTGNSARSQMAEAFLHYYDGERFEAFSAGLEPQGVNPYTRQVMQEKGISLEGHYSKHIKEYMGKVHFDYVVTVCSKAEESCPAVFPKAGAILHWSFNDPAALAGSDEEKLVKFREIRDQIEQRIKDWLQSAGLLAPEG